MVLIRALPFGKGVVFAVRLLIAEDAWIDLHTPKTNNHAVVNYQEEKKICGLRKQMKDYLFQYQGRSSKAT